MAEYIDREALMRQIKEIHCTECDSYNGVRCRACWVDDTLDYIDSEPAADVAPVVRCKDCKFGDWDSEPDDAMVCMRTKDGFWRSGNDFCSYGERKGGANDG